MGDLVSEWSRELESADRSAHTVRAYEGSVRDCLLWYESEEGRIPQLRDLTPIVLLQDLGRFLILRIKNGNSANDGPAGASAGLNHNATLDV